MICLNKYKPLDEVYELIKNANILLTKVWSSQIVFSWRWWLQLILTIIPWIIWIKYRDKRQTVRLLFVGMIVAMTTNALDIIGGNFNLWHYDWKVFPFAPMYIPWDFTLFPIIVMVFLQIKPDVKPIYKSLIFAIYSSFLSEPLFQWMGLYHPIKWKHWYSFFIYILLYLFYNYIYNSRLFQSNEI